MIDIGRYGGIFERTGLESGSEQLTNQYGLPPDEVIPRLLSKRITPSTTIPQLNLFEAYRPSSMGSLDALPTEIKHMILGMLDLRTISHIAQVSVHGRSLIETLPDYARLVQSAPYALTTLTQTRMLGVHPWSAYRSALRSGTCSFCPDYGAYLFILGCVRSCFNCLRQHPSLRTISTADAQRFLQLEQHHFDQLPPLTFTSKIDGETYSLISTTAAIDLITAEHGSEETLKNSLDVGFRGKADFLYMAKFLLQGGTCTAEHQVHFAHTGKGPLPPTALSSFFGMGAMPFPSFQGAKNIEHGILCKGCHRNYVYWESGQARIFWDFETKNAMMQDMRRAWRREDFLEHLKECQGVKMMIHDYATR